MLFKIVKNKKINNNKNGGGVLEWLQKEQENQLH